MKIGDFIRQGDVALVMISDMPSNLIEKDKILALGETSGHKHQFVSPQVQVFADRQGNQFVDVKERAMLQHEEHAHLQVPIGKFRVVLQREFDILNDMTRQVLD